jgi:hypothetical protein
VTLVDCIGLAMVPVGWVTAVIATQALDSSRQTKIAVWGFGLLCALGATLLTLLALGYR